VAAYYRSRREESEQIVLTAETSLPPVDRGIVGAGCNVDQRLGAEVKKVKRSG
jgi:hypothetical protein